MEPVKLYDVVAVNIQTRVIRLLAANKSERNAEAVVAMAVARRGVGEEFYSEVPSGRYAEGDFWEGV